MYMLVIDDNNTNMKMSSEQTVPPLSSPPARERLFLHVKRLPNGAWINLSHIKVEEKDEHVVPQGDFKK